MPLLRRGFAQTLSLIEWSEFFLSSYFPLPFSRFHEWLFHRLDGLSDTRGVRDNIVAPRGSAKSTLSSMAYPLRCAVEGTEKYIVLTSDTGQQACKFIDAIRTELETNERLMAYYPESTGAGRVWSQDRLILKNGVQIEALGTGTRIRGRRHLEHRPTFVLADDPQNKEHILSPLQRERSWEWLVKDVLNAGGPETNYVVLGTALHRECIVCKLQSTPGWFSKVWQSIEVWPTHMHLWQEWQQVFIDEWAAIVDRQSTAPTNTAEPAFAEAVNARAFYTDRKGMMDAGSRVLWPEREPLYDLMALRATIGPTAFAGEKQNDPVNPESCEFPAEYFDYPGFWFERWPTDIGITVLACDPSKGGDAKRGDYQAHVVVGRSRDGYLYVEADLRRQDIEAMVETGCGLVRRFKPAGFAIETNQFQSLLVADYRRVAQRLGLESLPVYPVVNTLNKGVRIRRITPYLSQRRLRFKRASPGTALLVQQLRDFPAGDHDDGADALEVALRLLVQLWTGRAKR